MKRTKISRFIILRNICNDEVGMMNDEKDKDLRLRAKKFALRIIYLYRLSKFRHLNSSFIIPRSSF